MTGSRDSYENIRGAFTGDKQFHHPRMRDVNSFRTLDIPSSNLKELAVPVEPQASRSFTVVPEGSGTNGSGVSLSTDRVEMNPFRLSQGSEDPIMAHPAEEDVIKIVPSVSVKGDDCRKSSNPTKSEEIKQPNATLEKLLADSTTAVDITKMLPHLRPNPNRKNKNARTEVPKVETKPEPVTEKPEPKLTPSKVSTPVNTSRQSPPAAVVHTAQLNRKDPTNRLKPAASPSLVPKAPPTIHTTEISPSSQVGSPDAVRGKSNWSNPTGPTRLVVNTPTSAANAYQLPIQPSSNTYGSPRGPRPRTTITEIDPTMEKALFFNKWPVVEARDNKQMRRTIIITGLPTDSSLAMVSDICKGTGLVESIILMQPVGKAMVWFIEATDAEKFFDRSGNGVEFTYPRSNKKGFAFVEMKDEVDVLSSVMHTNVTEKGHTRVLRIVGWAREDLERLCGAKGAKDEPYETLLKRLARMCSSEGKVERLEGVTAGVNSLGYNEATMIFSEIKEAYHVLGQLTRKAALEECNITFGRDPCEPVITPRV